MSNLTSRHLAASNLQEFDYDELNRVTHVNNEQLFHYDNNGNLTEKEGWILGYEGNDKPLHAAVSRTKDNITETYGYDDNGNQTWGKKNGNAWRTLTYSGRNKATNITVENSTTTFSYDAKNKRFKRTDKDGTIFYVGNLELTIKDGESASSNTNPNNSEQETYIKRYLGDAMQTYYANGNAMLRWLYKDNLGSVIAITNDSGKLVKRFSYDVFGLQTEIIPTQFERELNYELSLVSMLRLAEISSNTRGYTGHEPVAFDGDNRIVHMNGRMYDAALGRMLQADPVVQAPSNLQNYNAYSYVLNNPLNMTDPSGYFFSKLWKKIKPFVGLIVAIVGAWLCGAPCAKIGWQIAAVGAASGAAQAAVNGGNILTGALLGAFTAGVGQYGYAAAAIAGGVASKVQGGKFGHGFWAAGLGSAIGGGYGKSWAKVVTAAIVGGTISKLTGGKFKNGAISAAFSAAMAADWGDTGSSSSSSSSSTSSTDTCPNNHCAASVGRISDLSYDQLVELRRGLYDARGEGYDAVSIDLSISKINKQISSIIGIQPIDTTSILIGYIQRQYLESQRALVTNTLNIVGTVAGYCGAPQCQAISWGTAAATSALHGQHGGLVGNYGSALFGNYVESRLRLKGINHSPYLDAAQGEVSRRLAEKVDEN